MKIKVSDLKDFFRRSAKIKSNGVLPIYDYLLIEGTFDGIAISKSNGNMYCRHTIEIEGPNTEKLLVEEKRLAALVGNAKGEYIHFLVKGNKVFLKDASNKIELEAMKEVDINSFKTFTETDNAERTTLSAEVLSSLFEAKDFCAAFDSNYHYVYAHKKENSYYIFSSNGHVIYLKRFNESFPELTLSPDVCAIVCQYPNVQYFTSGNYIFFDTGVTTYGFIKTIFYPVEYMPIVNSVQQDKQITICRADVVSFCELVLSLAVQKYPVLKFEDTNSNSLLLQYEEAEYNVKTAKELTVQKNFLPDTFSFNAAYLAMCLKCFSSEEVAFSASANQNLFCLTHSDEPGLSIIIAKIRYQ